MKWYHFITAISFAFDIHTIALDKKSINITCNIFFLILHENISCS